MLRGRLRRDGALSGHVRTKFQIERDGSVSNVGDAGSTLKDREVVACVERTYAALRFPAPEGGVVKVVHPIRFAPTD